eukprot:gene6617-13402_t
MINVYRFLYVLFIIFGDVSIAIKSSYFKSRLSWTQSNIKLNPRSCLLMSTNEAPEIEKRNVTRSNGPSTSRFSVTSKKMLDEAQQLRIQAEEMEAAAKASGLFPSKVSNVTTDVVAPVVSSPPAAAATTKGSLLTNRNEESERRASLLGKISGEITKSNIQSPPLVTSNSKNITVPNDFIGLKIPLPNENLYSLKILASTKKFPTNTELYDAFDIPGYLRWGTGLLFKNLFITDTLYSTEDKDLLEICGLMELLNMFDATNYVEAFPDENLPFESLLEIKLPMEKPKVTTDIFDMLVSNPGILQIRTEIRFGYVKRILANEIIPELLDNKISQETTTRDMSSGSQDQSEEISNLIPTSTLFDIEAPLDKILNKLSFDSRTMAQRIIHIQTIRKEKGLYSENNEDDKLLRDMLRLLADNQVAFEKLKEGVDVERNNSLRVSSICRELELETSQSGELSSTLSTLATLISLTENQSTDDKNNNGTTTTGTGTEENMELMERLKGIFDQKSAELTEFESRKSVAERTIAEYFDMDSRASGLVLSREGAGVFQNEILTKVFTVTNVQMSQGCAILDGSSNLPSDKLSSTIEERLKSTGMNSELGFILVKNEKFVDLDRGLQQAALDMMLGSSDAIIVYPSSWNSTATKLATDPLRVLWRRLLTTCTIISSGAFAANCFDLFGTNGPLFQETPYIPDGFIYLTLTPVFIQLFALFAESFAAKARGITGSEVLLPSFSIPLFGGKMTYGSLPKTRKDIFDTAAIGISTGLITSLITLVIGFQLSLGVSNEIANTFPTISLSILKVNTIISQLTEYLYPGIFETLVKIPDATMHLHWLAIAGAVTFIGNTLQLIPVNNSAGSKMSFAALGIENYSILSVVTGLIKGIFILTLIFGSSGAAGSMILNKPRLFGDYIIASQLVSEPVDTDLAQDSITGISEGRKILYAAFIFLLGYSAISSADFAADASEILSNGIAYLKSVFGSTSALTPPVNF